MSPVTSRLKPILGVLAAICALATSEAVAGSAIVVRDEVIRVGDIFPNAGPQTETIVLRAPAPGEKIFLDTRWLGQAARAYGITWHPVDRDDGLTVERASQVVSQGAIDKAISAALAKVAGNGHVELAGRTPDIHLAIGMAPQITVEDVKFEWDTRRFSANIAVSAGDQRPRRVRVAGSYYETARLPVLRRPVTAGEVISASDIELVSIRGRKLAADTVSGADLVAGKAAKRTLRAGEPIRVADLQEPMLVAKKSLVTLMVQTPYLTITTQGRALEDGALGDSVQVVNAKSNKTVIGVVAGPDTVIVTSDRPVAMNVGNN